jgi:Uma2 family endonuclease
MAETIMKPRSKPAATAAPGANRHFRLHPEDTPIVNVDHLIVEDGEPLESMYIEKLMRLLTEPLYTSWHPGFPFVALANVGLFPIPKNPPLAPDVMLSIMVAAPPNLQLPQHRSYFVWEYKKPPDVIIEFVSDKHAGEEYYKAIHYAHAGVPYYVIFDPHEKLKKAVLRTFERRRRVYRPLAQPWFDRVGLGLTLWTGRYENCQAQWLRWCDQGGKVIPTGQELAEQLKVRAKQQQVRAKQQKAIAEQQTALAEQERQRREQLAAHLRSLGIDPETLS